MPRCRVVRFVAGLDALCAGLGEQVDVGGEDVAGKTSSLVIVLGATKTRLDVGVVPFAVGHVMRTLHRVEATGQPVVIVQHADGRSSLCGQPRFDQSFFLGREAMADQNLTQDVIGKVDLEADDFEP